MPSRRAYTVMAVAGAAVAGATYVACACTILAPSGPTSFPCTPTSFNASNPAASGYQVVFQTNFQAVGTSTIDVNDTRGTGFQWYVKPFFGNTPEVPGAFTSDANGLILNQATNNGPNFGMSTVLNGAGNFWRGTVFSNGAYFEAVVSFDGANVNNCFNTQGGGSPCGWPSFWTMSLEHDLSSRCTDAQWPGQASCYEHFMEDDWFEYDLPGNNSGNTWGSGTWDWSGIGGSASCTGYSVNGPAYCGLLNNGSPQNPNNFQLCRASGCPAITWNVATFHTIGALWVAGDASNSFAGYRKIFIDGVEAVTPGGATDTVSWSKTTMPSPAALPNSPQVWSIHDYHKFPIIFGTGSYNFHAGGNSMPFHIKSVKAWQIPNCGVMTTQ